MDLYERLKAAKVPLDSHESDLYVKVTPESTAIVAAYRREWADQYGREPVAVTTFASQTDNGALWYDIPFAYTPWWEKRK
jgi:hypothetical protein